MIQIEGMLQYIATLPGAKVDRGFGQGQEVVRKQYELLLGEEISDLYLEGKFVNYHDTMSDIRTWVLPYTLPEDYEFFLEFCGGFVIKRQEYTLVMDGNGPMCEEWYSYLRGDGFATEPSQDGMMQIGQLQFRDSLRDWSTILFFLDFAGRFQKNSIIGVGPWADENIDIHHIIVDPASYESKWKILAKSFTDWLDLIVETQGSVGYS